MQITSIGIIHSPFETKKETPLQPSCSDAIGQVELFKKCEDGLKDITGFSHLILIYRFHKSRGYKLLVKPFLDNRLRGLFSTRYPCLPNQLGISVVQLIKKKDNILYVKGIDVLDGTPLLDIKPYAPFFTVPAKIKTGWMKKKWEVKNL